MVTKVGAVQLDGKPNGSTAAVRNGCVPVRDSLGPDRLLPQKR